MFRKKKKCLDCKKELNPYEKPHITGLIGAVPFEFLIAVILGAGWLLTLLEPSNQLKELLTLAYGLFCGIIILIVFTQYLAATNQRCEVCKKSHANK